MVSFFPIPLASSISLRSFFFLPVPPVWAAGTHAVDLSEPRRSAEIESWLMMPLMLYAGFQTILMVSKYYCATTCTNCMQLEILQTSTANKGRFNANNNHEDELSTTEKLPKQIPGLRPFSISDKIRLILPCLAKALPLIASGTCGAITMYVRDFCSDRVTVLIGL